MGRFLQPGQFLQKRYNIFSLLAKGGMGAVYLARDIRLEIPVAIKEMIPQPDLDEHILEQLCQQFKQEAMVLARLQHPHLVRVTDFFEEGENAYLVMDFVAGENLSSLIDQHGPLSEAQALVWIKQLLGALAYCHSQGVFHRDIKPQNVIIRPNGQVVLVDFGLVKLWDPNDPHTKTAMRGVGTAEYAPPEQYDAKGGHTDARADLYSLGALLYHILTGQTPPTVTMRVVDPQTMPLARRLNPGLSEQVEKVVLKAMELQPKARFQTAEEMLAALTGQMTRPTDVPVDANGTRNLTMQADQPSTETRLAAPVQQKALPLWLKRRGGIILAMLAIGLVMVGVLARLWVNNRATAMPAMSQTVTVSVTPTMEDTLTFTPTPTASSTPTPMPTSTPTPSHTPTSTATLTPTRTFTPRPPTFTPAPPTLPPATETPSPEPTNPPPPPKPTHPPPPPP